MNQPANTLRIIKEGSKEAERYRKTIAKTQPAGAFELAFASAGRAIDTMLPIFKKAVETFTAELNKEDLQDYQMRRWLSQVPHGGIVGDKAVLIVYNEEHPSQSYLVVEDI